MKTIQCCYRCRERHEACHDRCQRHKAEKAAVDAERELIQSERTKQRDVERYIVRKCEMLKEISKYARRKMR